MGKPGRGFILRDAKQREYDFEVLEEPEIGRDSRPDPGRDDPVHRRDRAREGRGRDPRGLGHGHRLRSPLGRDPGHGHRPGLRSQRLLQAAGSRLQPGRPAAPSSPARPSRSSPPPPPSSPGRSRLSETFDCREGSIAVPGGAIRDHKLVRASSTSPASSSIPPTSAPSRSAGASTRTAFEAMIRAFGFGRRTGIELPGEAAGKLRPPAEWSRRSQASLSIGYEISVTPLQILQAINVVANRGRLVPPRIVKSIQGGRPRPATRRRPPRPVRGRRARSSSASWSGSSVEGTGKEARPDGYDAAGKTGHDPEVRPGRQGLFHQAPYRLVRRLRPGGRTRGCP